MGFSRAEWQSVVVAPSVPIDKSAFVLERVVGKDVLDIGCVDHHAERADGDGWLHRAVAGVASSLVGLDYLADDVARLRALGFDVREGDATDFDLDEQFDVVVAGDIVEHLLDVGGFLTSVAAHLRPGGVVILTTPNPFNLEQSVWALFKGRIQVNEEHVAWLDPMVMWQLLDRCGYDVVDFAWIETGFHFPVIGRRPYASIINWTAQRLMRSKPMLRRDYAVVARVGSRGVATDVSTSRG